jgi:hypothetical protein
MFETNRPQLSQLALEAPINPEAGPNSPVAAHIQALWAVATQEPIRPEVEAAIMAQATRNHTGLSEVIKLWNETQADPRLAQATRGLTFPAIAQIIAFSFGTSRSADYRLSQLRLGFINLSLGKLHLGEVTDAEFQTLIGSLDR